MTNNYYQGIVKEGKLTGTVPSHETMNLYKARKSELINYFTTGREHAKTMAGVSASAIAGYIAVLQSLLPENTFPPDIIFLFFSMVICFIFSTLAFYWAAGPPSFHESFSIDILSDMRDWYNKKFELCQHRMKYGYIFLIGGFLYLILALSAIIQLYF